jgi:protein TonB
MLGLPVLLGLFQLISPAHPQDTSAPPPPAPSTLKSPQPRAPGSWISYEDYPVDALRAGEQGVVGFRLDVDPAGRVTGCTVTASSGSAILDSATCAIMRRRARFVPAEDAEGKPVAGYWDSRSRWSIPN